MSFGSAHYAGSVNDDEMVTRVKVTAVVEEWEG